MPRPPAGTTTSPSWSPTSKATAWPRRPTRRPSATCNTRFRSRTTSRARSSTRTPPDRGSTGRGSTKTAKIKTTVIVNGENKGDLSPEQSRSLTLRPGAYRFEAQSGGSQAASTVVTVRGDTPMDVFLEMPKGASEQSAAAGKDAQAGEAAAPS